MTSAGSSAIASATGGGTQGPGVGATTSCRGCCWARCARARSITSPSCRKSCRGFWRKSKLRPSRRASIASARVAWPLKKITATLGSMAFRPDRRCKPSQRGILRSVSTTSKGWRLTRSRASSPSFAPQTACPFKVSHSQSVRRRSSSSSATKIRASCPSLPVMTLLSIASAYPGRLLAYRSFGKTARSPTRALHSGTRGEILILTRMLVAGTSLAEAGVVDV
ncbi:hypothetical protein D3C87_1349650 [compost metagenome]